MKHLPASAGRIEAVWQNNIPSRVTSLQPMGKAQSAGWTKLNAPTTELLRSVHFLSESNGWVAGANGALLRTSNGGASWAAVSAGLNTGQNDFKTVRFVNANVGWLGSGNGMARTSDGGANWQIYEMPAGINGASDQVFLVLFGTGTRARSALSALAATLGGIGAEVLYAGAAPGLIGVDQFNLRLPRSLNGRGEIELALTVESAAANVLRVNIK